jgi:hypothetical protein
VAGDFSLAWSRRLGGEAGRDAPDEAHDRFGRALARSHLHGYFTPQVEGSAPISKRRVPPRIKSSWAIQGASSGWPLRVAD